MSKRVKGKKLRRQIEEMQSELKAAHEELRSVRDRNFEAGYDAAQTRTQNRKHWEEAHDHDLPPSWLNTPSTRATLRKRAQYERDNNCYCSGLVSTLATDVIGFTAPRLRILSNDSKLKDFIEDEWKGWANHRFVNLPQKLRVMEEERRTVGASFPTLFRDEEVAEITGYSLNFDIIPDARITDPDVWYSGEVIERDGKKLYNDDGVVVDTKNGRPVEYKVTPIEETLRWGGSGFRFNQITVPSRYMTQWFVPRRAGQYRGISELIPALPLFSVLRRYDLAELTAAETASVLSALMKTPLQPGETPHEVSAWREFPINRGMAISLPLGYEPFQMKPEHPVSAYEMFVNLILRQIGRSLDVPFGIIAGDSSRYNYSSARLDYQGYDSRVSYDRRQLVIMILEWMYEEWFLEMRMMRPDVERAYKSGDVYNVWAFTSRPSSDPTKEAEADDIRLKNGSTTLAASYAERGLDWQEEMEQLQKEIQKLKSMGLDHLIQSKPEKTEKPAKKETSNDA